MLYVSSHHHTKHGKHTRHTAAVKKRDGGETVSLNNTGIHTLCTVPLLYHHYYYYERHLLKLKNDFRTLTQPYMYSMYVYVLLEYSSTIHF